MHLGLGRIDKARRRGQAKAIVSVHAHVGDGMAIAQSDSDYRKSRQKTLEAEVKALEKQLSDFDPKEAAEKVRKALDLELRSKKLELEQNKLRLEA